jgi:hypothetical protein
MIRCIDFGSRDQSVEVETQLVVKAFLNGAAEQAGQNKSAGDEAKNQPDRGARDQPEGQRIGLGEETSQLCSSAALGSSSL